MTERRFTICDVCGTVCSSVEGPDGVRYCATCYETAFGTSSKDKERNAERQNKIRDLTMQKILSRRAEV